MSDHIKQILKSRLESYLSDNPPKDGQLLAARYDDPKLADTVSEAVKEMKSASVTTLELAGDRNDAVVIDHSTGEKIYVVRVLTEIEGDRDPVEVTQAGSSGLRNYILDESIPDRNAAGFIIIDRSTDIETLGPAEFLTDDDGPLNPAAVVEFILNPAGVDNPAGKAVLRAVDRFKTEQLSITDGTSILDVLARIRLAVEKEDREELGEALGGLPNLLEIDTLTPDFFESNLDEDSREKLEDELYGEFLDAQEHVEKLRKAFDRGADTEEILKEKYKQEAFIDDHKQDSDWSDISLSEANTGSREVYDQKDEKEDDSSESSGGDSSSSSGEKAKSGKSRGNGSSSSTGLVSPSGTSSTTTTGGSSTPSPDELSMSIDTATLRGPIQTPFTKADMRYVVRCWTDSDEFTVTLKFTDDITDINYVCNPAEDGTDVVVDKDEVQFKITVTDDDGIQWEQLEVYLESTNRKGYPTFQVDLAILPEWWYQTLTDMDLDIDYKERRFAFVNEESFQITPPDPFDDREQESTTIDDEDAEYVVNRPGIYYPEPPLTDDDVATLPFTLAPPEKSGVDVSIPILAYRDKDDITELDVRLPLALDVIMNPDRWDHENLVINTGQVNEGNIKAGGKSFTPSNNQLAAVVGVEEDFVEDQSPAPREYDSQSIQSNTDIRDTVELPEDLATAYDQLFEHFADRSTIPSADPWDADTVQKVRNVVEEYIDVRSQELNSETYTDIRDLGTVQSRHSDTKTWVSAFHPLMLTYGLRLVEWRNNVLAPDGLEDGFRDEHLGDHLDPTGLLPYRSADNQEADPLHSQSLPGHSLWMWCSPTESYDVKTPSFMSEVVAGKVSDFYQTFEPIFEIHESRPLTINFLNMGDLSSCIEGLFEFFKQAEEDGGSPPIEIRVYGDGEQGQSLDRLFSTDEEADAILDADETIIDQFRSRISYTHPRLEDGLKDAQLTFFRGVLEPEFFSLELDALPDRLLRGGLLPEESTKVRTTPEKREYQNGFSGGSPTGDTVESAARVANQIEHGYSNNGEYSPRDKIVRKVESGREERFNEIHSHSSWAVHVQPPIGIEFYADPRRSNANGGTQSRQDPLIIHYDNGKTSLPGYDVITTTNREELYVDALREEVQKIDTKEVADPARILDVLAAIEGGSVTALQRASSSRIKYLIGMAGTLILSQAILNEFKSDYAWVGINLANEMQHDRATRNARPRTIRVPGDQRASDDLMFVGVPTHTDGDDLALKLWFAEAKGGTSSASSGIEQVQNTIEEVQYRFNPSEGYSDTEIFRTVVGRLICDGASRLENYDLLSDEDIATVESHRDRLLNGDYTVSLLEDRNGANGESINIGGTELTHDVKHTDDVRTIQVSTSVFGLLKDQTVDDLFTSLDTADELGF